MSNDDEVCLCFHVTRRKVLNFLRIEKPRRPGQLSDCHGAGTGCGWCRPFLEEMWEAHQEEHPVELPTPAEYAARRQAYLRRKER